MAKGVVKAALDLKVGKELDCVAAVGVDVAEEISLNVYIPIAAKLNRVEVFLCKTAGRPPAQ
jgi:hypothetical protein